MSTPTLPPITSLPTADEETLNQVLDTLFEPSPEIHQIAIPLIRQHPPTTNYSTLIQEIGQQLSSQGTSTLHKILSSHPRLGAKKVDSAQSRAEQANLNSHSDDAEEEGRKLEALNREYEDRFPGLRYVVFVNGRGRDVVMRDMRRRIDRGDFGAEEKEGIQVRFFFFFFLTMG